MRAFSLVAVSGNYSLVAVHRLFTGASLVAEHAGLVVPGHVGSSQTRDRTHVPYIGKQTS